MATTMRAMPVMQAKRSLGKLLDLVDQGEKIMIFKNGKLYSFTKEPNPAELSSKRQFIKK